MQGCVALAGVRLHRRVSEWSAHARAHNGARRGGMWVLRDEGYSEYSTRATKHAPVGERRNVACQPACLRMWDEQRRAVPKVEGVGRGAAAIANGACDGRDVLARHLAHVVRSLARHLISRHGRRRYRRPRLPRVLRHRPAGDKPRPRGRSPTSLALHSRGEPGPAWIGASPVPAWMWQG